MELRVLYSLNQRLSLAEELDLRLYNFELKFKQIFERQDLLEDRIKLLELDLEELYSYKLDRGDNNR